MKLGELNLFWVPFVSIMSKNHNGSGYRSEKIIKLFEIFFYCYIELKLKKYLRGVYSVILTWGAVSSFILRVFKNPSINFKFKLFSMRLLLLLIILLILLMAHFIKI